MLISNCLCQLLWICFDRLFCALSSSVQLLSWNWIMKICISCHFHPLQMNEIRCTEQKIMALTKVLNADKLIYSGTAASFVFFNLSPGSFQQLLCISWWPLLWGRDILGTFHWIEESDVHMGRSSSSDHSWSTPRQHRSLTKETKMDLLWSNHHPED